MENRNQDLESVEIACVATRARLLIINVTGNFFLS
jgi:hypothetical protein